jgi:hypothetical protein
LRVAGTGDLGRDVVLQALNDDADVRQDAIQRRLYARVFAPRPHAACEFGSQPVSSNHT